MSDKMTYRYFMPLYARTQKDKEERVRNLAEAFPERFDNPKLEPAWRWIAPTWHGFTRTVFLVVE